MRERRFAVVRGTEGEPEDVEAFGEVTDAVDAALTRPLSAGAVDALTRQAGLVKSFLFPSLSSITESRRRAEAGAGVRGGGEVVVRWHY